MADDAVAVKGAGLIGDHMLAIAQNGDAVGNRQRLFQRVGDEDDRHPIGLEPRDQTEEMVLFLGGEGRGRFVKDDDPRLVVDGTGDFHHLLLRRAQLADEHRGIDVEVQRLQELLGGNVDAAQAVQEPFVAQIDVLRHRQRGHQRGFLEHHRNAVVQRIGGAGKGQRRAAEPHLAMRRAVNARDDLGQRRLAGAILSQKRVNLARHQGEVDVAQGRDTVEFLGHAP